MSFTITLRPLWIWKINSFYSVALGTADVSVGKVMFSLSLNTHTDTDDSGFHSSD